MANRAATITQRGLERYPWQLWARVLFQGTGAPILQVNLDGKGWVTAPGANATGITAVRRTPGGQAAGDFQLVCADNFVRFLYASFQWMGAAYNTDLSAAPFVKVIEEGAAPNGTDPHANGGAVVEFVTTTTAAGSSRANPASGAILLVALNFGDSTAY